MYRIEVSQAAERDFVNLGKRIQRHNFECLKVAIDNLASEPLPLGVRKLKGSERAFRIRVGNYRVVYEIYDAEKLLLILQVVRRSESTYRL